VNVKVLAIAFVILASAAASSPRLRNILPQEAKDVHQDPCNPSCIGQERPACEETWAPHVSAVFVGTVTDIKLENGTDTARYVATVNVDEAFLGVHANTVTVVSGGGSCGGFPFSKGRRYLIYAKLQEDRTFNAPLCSGTKWLSEAGADLKYLRSLASAPPTSCVFGLVFRYTEPPNPDRPKALRRTEAYVGKKVWVRSDLHAYEAVIEKDEKNRFAGFGLGQGKFRVTGIEPGTYSVSVQAAEPVSAQTSHRAQWLDSGPQQEGVELTLHPAGCAQVDFTIDPFHHNGTDKTAP
jgi:hypothetical protein